MNIKQTNLTRLKKLSQIIFLSAAIFMIVSNVVNAQNKLDFSAQIRPRFEMDNRDFNQTTEAKNLGTLRSRVGVKFSPSDDVTVFFQAQDSRNMGFETSSLTNMKNLDVHQAYVQLNNFFNLPVDVKLGRMEITYGSGRFFGTNNWNNVGRALDGAIATLKGNKFQLDFIAIKDKENYQFGDSADVDILALFSELKIMSNHILQPFIMWQKNVPVEEFSRFTAGVYSKGSIGGLTHEIDFAYQFGQLTDYSIIGVPPGLPAVGTQLDISAYIISATLTYKFDIPVKPSFIVGLDVLSGDGNPADGNYNVFASPYGDKHKFYGVMDYFKNNSLHTSNLGLIDIRGGFAFEPLPKLNLKFDLHLLNSQEDFALSGGSVSKQFGTEADLTLKYKYNKYVSLIGGASVFFPGEIFEETKGKDNSTWFYFMSVVNL